MITFFAYNAGEQFAASHEDAMRLLREIGERQDEVGLWRRDELPGIRRKLIRVSNRPDSGRGAAEGVLCIVVKAQSAGTEVVWG